jgi:hypothetical protein
MTRAWVRVARVVVLSALTGLATGCVPIGVRVQNMFTLFG